MDNLKKEPRIQMMEPRNFGILVWWSNTIVTLLTYLLVSWCCRKSTEDGRHGYHDWDWGSIDEEPAGIWHMHGRYWEPDEEDEDNKYRRRGWRRERGGKASRSPASLWCPEESTAKDDPPSWPRSEKKIQQWSEGGYENKRMQRQLRR